MYSTYTGFPRRKFRKYQKRKYVKTFQNIALLPRSFDKTITAAYFLLSSSKKNRAIQETYNFRIALLKKALYKDAFWGGEGKSPDYSQDFYLFETWGFLIITINPYF